MAEQAEAGHVGQRIGAPPRAAAIAASAFSVVIASTALSIQRLLARCPRLAAVVISPPPSGLLR